MDGKGMVVTAFVAGSAPRDREAAPVGRGEEKERVVRDVMTSPVVTVPPDTPVKAVAEILLSNRVSAVPVVDAHGHVVGMISEADLLVKELAQGSGAHLPWFEGSHAQDIRRRREAVTAQGLMSAPVISVHPDTTVRQAAKTMCEKRIKRLPVVTGGWLVGIISRADVLRVYLLPDEQLRRHAERILRWALGPAANHLVVAVQEGVVIITGEVETRCEAELASRLLGRMEGVVGVDTRVQWRVDDPPATPSWR